MQQGGAGQIRTRGIRSDRVWHFECRGLQKLLRGRPAFEKRLDLLPEGFVPGALFIQELAPALGSQFEDRFVDPFDLLPALRFHPYPLCFSS